MGPSRRPDEPESAFRLRYAVYCLRWFAWLAVGLTLLVILKPSIQGSPLPFLVMVLYVGIPLGTATSGLAAFGFLVGAFWSRRLERDRGLAQRWPKAKAWLRALGLLPLSGFGVFAIARGLMDGAVLIPWQHRPVNTVSLSGEPFGYCVVLLAWCAMTAGIVYYQFAELRRAHVF